MGSRMKEIAKAAARTIATIVIAPWVASFRVRARIIGADRALEGSTQLLALVPGLAGQYLRRAFLMRTLAGCHETAAIEFGTIFSRVGARIDEHAYIGPRCHIGLAHIGRGALIAAGVHVPSGGHIHGSSDLDVAIREQPGVQRMVRIGSGAWVGSAAVIMGDVGKDAIVGAGAVVTRPIPDRVIAAGVPARLVRVRARAIEQSDAAWPAADVHLARPTEGSRLFGKRR
jgi:virginiamycin A acetyltransferase